MIRLTILLIFAWTVVEANDISTINRLKKEAEQAYKAGNYEAAAANYAMLIDSLQIDDEQATMNLGHAYYQLGQKELAQSQYQKLVLSNDQQLKSMAYQQLGALSNDPKTLQKAMTYFKESIKSDPGNQDARYNYELVKKKLKDQQNQNQDNQDQDQENQDQENQDQENQDQQNQDQQNKDQENKDQQNQDQQNKDQQDQENKDQEGEEKDQQQDQEEQKDKEQQQQEQEQQQNEEGKEGEKSDQPPPSSPSDKMQEMQISEEKARMILEALKNNEVQYIQQNRRKPTKRKDSDKPDW